VLFSSRSPIAPLKEGIICPGMSGNGLSRNQFVRQKFKRVGVVTHCDTVGFYNFLRFFPSHTGVWEGKIFAVEVDGTMGIKISTEALHTC